MMEGREGYPSRISSLSQAVSEVIGPFVDVSESTGRHCLFIETDAAEMGLLEKFVILQALFGVSIELIGEAIRLELRTRDSLINFN